MVIQYLSKGGIEEQSYQIINYSFTTVHTALELSGTHVSQQVFSLDFLLETSHPKEVQGIIYKPNSKLRHRPPVMPLSVSSVSIMCLEKVSVLCPFLLFYLVILCCE